MDLDEEYSSKSRLQWIITAKRISNLTVLTILFKDREIKMKENSKSSRTSQGEKETERTYFHQPGERTMYFEIDFKKLTRLKKKPTNNQE